MIDSCYHDNPSAAIGTEHEVTSPHVTFDLCSLSPLKSELFAAACRPDAAVAGYLSTARDLKRVCRHKPITNVHVYSITTR